MFILHPPPCFSTISSYSVPRGNYLGSLYIKIYLAEDTVCPTCGLLSDEIGQSAEPFISSFKSFDFLVSLTFANLVWKPGMGGSQFLVKDKNNHLFALQLLKSV